MRLMTSGRKPAPDLGEEGLALFGQSPHRRCEQVPIAEPRHRTLQGGAVVMYRQRRVQCLVAFHVELQVALA